MRTDDKNILLLAGAMFVISEIEENHSECRINTKHAIAVNQNNPEDIHYTVVCEDCGEILVDIPVNGQEDALDELTKDVRELLETINMSKSYDKEMTAAMERKRSQQAAEELASKIKEDGFEDDFRDFLIDLFNQL